MFPPNSKLRLIYTVFTLQPYASAFGYQTLTAAASFEEKLLIVPAGT